MGQFFKRYKSLEATFKTQHHYNFIVPVKIYHKINFEMCNCWTVHSVAVDSGHRGKKKKKRFDVLSVDCIYFELRGGQSAFCQGLPLAIQRRHLGLIHQGICIEVQQCAEKHNELKAPKKMLCMMHSLQEINKQTKFGIQQGNLGSYF